MKITIKAIVAIASLFLVSSCSKFLTEKPYSTVSPDNFFKTASDAELALTGVYDILNVVSVQGQGNSDMFGRGLQYLTELGNDEMVTAANTTAGLIEYGNYSYTPSTSTAGFTWADLYAGINRANYILANVPAIDMDTIRKTQILAETHYLRGMYYFYLGWLWGGVPISTSTAPVLDAPRSSLQEVMTLAENDFQVAYAQLPARNPKVARVNKYTAAGFLAKLYLYLASCKENNVGGSLGFPLNSFAWVNQADMYSKALLVCQDAYMNGGYTLIRPYRYLFLAATEDTARAEHMMIVQSSPGGESEYFLATNLSGPKGNSSLVGGGYGFMTPVKEMYDKYNASDDRRTQNLTGSISATPTSEVVNGVKYFLPSTYSATTFSNMSLGKYRQSDPLEREAKGIPQWASETDFGVLRFADLILMYAEAKFKTGDEAGARTLIQQVRLRAVTDDQTKLSKITTAYHNNDFMQELLDERSRELCAEGWRRFDLIRTGKLASVITGLQTTTGANNTALVPGVKANFADYKIWYPVPSREIILNPNLVQNPGYEK